MTVAVPFLVFGGVATIMDAAKIASGRSTNVTLNMIALAIGFILLIWR
jgi:hypothetical protein